MIKYSPKLDNEWPAPLIGQTMENLGTQTLWGRALSEGGFHSLDFQT